MLQKAMWVPTWRLMMWSGPDDTSMHSAMKRISTARRGSKGEPIALPSGVGIYSGLSGMESPNGPDSEFFYGEYGRESFSDRTQNISRNGILVNQGVKNETSMAAFFAV